MERAHKSGSRYANRVVRLAAVSLATASIFSIVVAGGPWRIRDDGLALRWPGLVVTYHSDAGPLGLLTESEAQAVVRDAFAIWQAAGPLTLTEGPALPHDVNADGSPVFNPAHYLNYWSKEGDSPLPVIFDSDGSIMEDMFGAGAGSDILGITSMDTPATVHPPLIAEASIIINGQIIDGVAPDVSSIGAVTGVLVHEIGHALNLAHSVLNHELAFDGDRQNDRYIPSMYPALIENEVQVASLHPDDVAALVGLYGTPPHSISGTITYDGGFFPGAHVVARRQDAGDPRMDAYSFVSGTNYVPCAGGGCPPTLPPAAGQFKISGVAAGTYTVCVEQIPLRFDLESGSVVGPLAVPPVLPGPVECRNASESGVPAIDDPDSAPPIVVAGTVTAVDIQLNLAPASDPNDTGGVDNDTPTDATELTPMPQTAWGTLETADRDFFKFHVSPGQRVRIDVDAAELGYTIDPFIAVFDSLGGEVSLDGSQLISDDAIDPDTGEFSRDPWLEFVSEWDATLVVGVFCYPEFDYSGCDSGPSRPYWMRVQVDDDTDGDGTFDGDDVCPEDVFNDVDQDGLCLPADDCPTVDVPTPPFNDLDMDGILDECDICLGVVNSMQADADRDLVGDECDSCPDVYNPSQDSTDFDSDTIFDDCDVCPLTPDPLQLDDDEDGLGNTCDNCPGRFNPGQEDADTDGTGDACEDTDPPGVSAAYPSDRQLDVGTSTDIVLFLTEPVDADTVSLESVVLERDGVKVGGEVSVSNGTTLTFDPDTSLDLDTDYTIRVGEPIVDAWGNPIVGFLARFDTLGRSGPIETNGIGSDSAGVTIEGTGEATGFSIASLGDVNGDTVDDFIYGSPDADDLGRADSGTATVILGSDGLFGAGATIRTVQFVGAFDRQRAGRVVTSAGDFDGDEIEDIVIAAPVPTAGSSTSDSMIWVIYGHSSWGAEGEPETLTFDLGDGSVSDCITDDGLCGTVFYVSQDEEAGTSVASIGDFDQDGYDDLLIGAPGGEPDISRAGAGKIYLVYGDPLLRGATVPLTDVGPLQRGLIFHGETAGDAAGWSVSLWPDPDLPTDDLLIGAPHAITDDPFDVPYGASTGQVYAIHGTADNLSPSVEPGTDPWVMELSRVAYAVPPVDEITGVVFLGTEPGGTIGRSTEGGVDVDGDGVPDVIYAANGIVFVISGKGPKSTTTLAQSGASNTADPAATKLSRRVSGATIYNQFTATRFIQGDETLGPLVVAGAGDVNDDGVDDFIIGAPDTFGNSGRVYVVYGRRGGWDEEVTLAEIGDSVPGLQIYPRLDGEQVTDRLGESVGGGADVNFDGIADLLFGAPGAGANGEAYALTPVPPDEATALMLTHDPNLERTTLTWVAPDRATHHVVFRGTRAEMLAAGGVRSSAMAPTPFGSCAVPGTERDDTDNPPPPGQLFLYLVTAVNEFGEGPLGPPGASSPREHDEQCPLAGP